MHGRRGPRRPCRVSPLPVIALLALPRPRPGRLAALLVLPVASCAQPTVPAPAPRPAPAPVAPAPAPVAVARDPARPLDGATVVRAVDSLWSAAVARGTRAADGRPGPRLWTNAARYRLHATLDPRSGRVDGRGTLRYLNRSPDTLRTVVLQLAQNLFAKGAPHVEPVPVTGGVTVEGLCVARAGGADWRAPLPAGCSAEATAPRDPALAIDGTVATLALARPLAPGDSLELLARWHFTLPPKGAPRMGSDGEVAMVGYWYPQFAVLDDVVGWHVDPYLATGEFYADPADYDVAVTVPANVVVVASAPLRNAGEVLRPAVLQRLEKAMRSLAPVAVVTDSVRRARAVTLAGDALTWRFAGEGLRDFAFYASDAVVWDAGAALVPRPDGRPGRDTVLVQALYRPGFREWRKAADYLRVSVELFSRTLWPYPWRQMTAVEGIVEGGMEFPALTVATAGDARELFVTLAHETAHQWFPMQVSTDERRFAWIDEGLASWLERVAQRAETGSDDDVDGVPDFWRTMVRTGGEETVLRPADRYRSLVTYTVAAYERPVVALRAFALEYGDSALARGIRTFGEAWKGGRHPYPPDFVRMVFAAAGADRDAFAREWLYGTGHLDLALADVAAVGDTLAVTVRSRGGASLSTTLAVTRADGSVARLPIAAAALRDAAAAGVVVRIPSARTVRALQLDPERRLPDLDRSNDRWPRR